MTLEEGYIKFSQVHDQSPIPKEAPWEDLEQVRKVLHEQGLIGSYDNGIGYGNISIRWGSAFLITASATGGLPELQSKHYTLVTGYELDQNTVASQGLLPASSESMTHAAFYELSTDINAVLHVHHQSLWASLLNKVPTTAAQIGYGTPQMALEIARLWHQSDLKRSKITVTAGHEEGIFTFGKHLTQAMTVLNQYLR